MKKKMAFIALGLVLSFSAGLFSAYAGPKAEVNPFGRYRKKIEAIKAKMDKLDPKEDKKKYDSLDKKLQKEKLILAKAADKLRNPISDAIGKLEDKIDKLSEKNKDVSALEKQVEELNKKLDQIDVWEDEANGIEQDSKEKKK